MTEYDEKFAEQVGASLRRPHGFSSDYTARVMAAIAAEGGVARPASPRWIRQRSGLFASLIVPRPFMISPLAAGAIAALLLLASFGGMRAFSPGSRSGAVRTASLASAVKSDTVRLVQFVFVAPHAKTVSIVGDFNDWDRNATHLNRDGQEGLWTTSIPLPHGRHQYAFIVDGKRWMVDPSAPTAVENSYGTPNSVVTVAADAL